MSGELGRPAAQAATLLLCLLAATFIHASDTIHIEDIRIISPLEDQWGYIAIRPVYAETLAWMADARDGASTQTLTRMQDAATTGTLPRAVAALLASRESHTSLTISLERRQKITSAALAVIRDPNLGWGAAPLASQAVESSIGTGLAHRLLQQLGEDDVKHNATRGADLFRLGLIADPQMTHRILTERWIATPAPREDSPESQERVILASLLLSLAVDREEDFTDPSQTWLSLALAPPAPALPRRWSALPPATQTAALDAAQAYASDRWSSDDLATNLAQHNRERAWVLLELAEPVPVDELLAVLANQRVDRYDRYHAACVLMMRTPHEFLAPRGTDALASLVTEDYWRTTGIAQFLAETTGRSTAACDIMSPIRLVSDTIITPNCATAIDTTLAQRILDHLERDFIHRLELESRPFAQIGLWNFLLAAKSQDAAIPVANAAITNFVNDEEVGNASAARWALNELGHTIAEPAAESGLRVAEEIRDWQLAAECSDMLRECRPDRTMPEQPRLLRYMLAQLADDATDGNAAAAMRYIERCGPWADDTIRHVAENGDWQQVIYARQLLAQRP